jgi:hypothetical protein
MVLGLARYYAELGADQREHTMVFYFGGSHMIGAPANTAFMEAHADDVMSKLVVDIAIEHIADDTTRLTCWARGSSRAATSSTRTR